MGGYRRRPARREESVTADEPQSTSDQVRLLRRQVLQLAALIVVAVGAFLLTRSLAASNRDMRLADGAAWYARGQQRLAAGDVPAAIDAFRRATVSNRTNTGYVLALARALAQDGRDDAARRVLLGLRETAPENIDVNLALARLAARGGDVTTAARYYHNALYVPWPDGQTAERRGVRAELADLLLSHGRTAAALSELLVLASNLPADPALHRDVARRFAAAGDHRHALDEFERALRGAPDDGEALAGAGQAALALGDYARARRYLARAPDRVEGVATARDLVAHVLDDDPLAPRIGAARRASRLRANLAYAAGRLQACLASGPAAVTDADRALDAEARQAQAADRRRGALDEDAAEAGVDLAARLATAAGRLCPPATTRDRALVLIDQRHGDSDR
jgi:tetratricopeptide (TPR) repeat protein